MKNVTLCLLTAILLLGLQTANARARLHLLSSIGEGDACDHLTGSWAGDGTVSTSFLTCNYHGEGEIDQPHDFSLDIHLHRISGSYFCPKSKNIIIQGHCENNEIQIHNDSLDLNGTLHNNSAVLNGKILKPVTADLELTIDKQQ